MPDDSLIFSREIKERHHTRKSESYAMKAERYGSRRNVEHTFFEPIYPDYGVSKMLADEYKLSESTIHRYLRGKFTEIADQFERILEIREKAKTMTSGLYLYVVRDRNGELQYFRYEPRKDEEVWYDPINRYERHLFPESLLPPGANPRWEDKFPTRVQIRNYNQLR